MIQRRSRTAAALVAAASLLLTACGGGDEEGAAPKPKHPVFDQPLDRQVLLALRRTQEADASFTQTLTFASKKGRAVQTVTGKLDFAKGVGEATVTWRIPKAFDAEAKDVLLGRTPGRAFGDTSGSYLIDRDRIRYRARSSGYWITYSAADTLGLAGSDRVAHLRGTESPVGGMLLEGVSGAEASGQHAVAGGRTYRAQLPNAVTQDLFPSDVNRALSTPLGRTAVREAGHPLTVSVDAEGRITHSRADLTRLLGKDGVFADMTSLTMELALSRHGASRPATAPRGKLVRSTDAVLPVAEVKTGGCVDFNTGQRDMGTVVAVDCEEPHDGRVWAQKSLGERRYPGASAARSAARAACRGAYDAASSRWTDESVEDDRYWYMWSGERDWDEAGEGRVTCYVVTRKGAV
ncbi:septum formation family protein [Streptomyces sp. Je 1-79]|uniref:septum formation family protein n=1 Tax=Streptomyces sp. Je 1-79 TaxID=2943847 RepID=UPI0021A44003|nr:septum formation family protein [Streptomyces sp. Je 1-79]MCT4355326.1 septum formation family protein [Streptomyces sp. Je 1-79]